MLFRHFLLGAFLLVFLEVNGRGAPAIDAIPNVTIPAGKSLSLPITASSPSGTPLTYTITSSTNAIAVVSHTNDPFWQLTVAQAAPANAPGAYATPFRGGSVTVTNVGTMTFMLFPEYAPHTVNIFQGLTAAGFYSSNTIFHRVVSDFVIQGGDPLTNGSGGLVFQYDDEFHPQALFSGNGQLALANAGKNTDGSQFFVTVGPQRFLDFGYPIFGQLVRGFPVLTNIDNTSVDTNSRPLADEIIQSAAFVSDTTDTVITLTATNVAGKSGKITVVAVDGTGARATNTFTATIQADTNSDYNPLLFPNTITNLVAPLNHSLTNFVTALELDSVPLEWSLAFADQLSANGASNASYNVTNTIYRTLTYNITNIDGKIELFLTPSNNFAGPMTIYFDVDAGYETYGEQVWTFVFGDTPIGGQTNTVHAGAGTPFANLLLATFTNGVAGSAATNFNASINWGDNSISSGVIQTNGSGQKTVLGSHTYTNSGAYPVYVTVQSAIGASATFLSYVYVATAPTLTPVSATNGFSFNLQVAGVLTGSIQVSTDLATWTTFANFAATNTTLSFHDPTNSAARFYRAVIP